MKATKIKMKLYCGNSRNVQDIDSIYIDSVGTYLKKEKIYDHLKLYPKSIQVNIYPYSNLIPAISALGEKYVRSQANDTINDNLLNLPREQVF